MKKLFLVLAIGAFVACNDDAEGTTTTDTLNTSTDTTLVSPVDTTYRDTTARPDSTIRK